MTQMMQRWVLNDRGAARTAVTVPENISSGAAGWNWFTQGRDEDSSEGKNLQLSELEVRGCDSTQLRVLRMKVSPSVAGRTALTGTNQDVVDTIEYQDQDFISKVKKKETDKNEQLLLNGTRVSFFVIKDFTVNYFRAFFKL